MTDAGEDGNAEQREFWNGPPGQRWVTHDADLERMMRGAGDIVLREAAPAPGERILEIGCGAGATALACAGAVGPQGHVTGLDISAPLLALAEQRRRAAAAANVAFVAGDAQTHALPRAHFDAAVSRFGVMFFADPVAAFRNIAASLRTGGRLVLAAWSGLERNPWFRIPREAAIARLGPVPPSDPDAPGPMAFRDIDRVVGLLAAAGLSGCRGERRPIEIHHPGDVAALAALAIRIGPAARVIRQCEAGEAETAAIADDLAGRLAHFAAPDGIRIPAEITLFRAVAG